MRTISHKIEELGKEVIQILEATIAWNGQESKNYREQCLKISGADLNGDDGRAITEVMFLDGEWMLVDEDGLQYQLSFLSIEEQSVLIDYANKVNPYSDEAKEFPVIEHTTGEDLTEFPNFDKSGSIYGMKNKYYGKGAMLLKHGGYIYNVTSQPELYIAQYDPEEEYMEEE